MKLIRAICLGPGVVLLAGAVGAAPPASVRMIGDEAGCPTPTQVVTVLRRLLPRTKVTADTGQAALGDALITDEGSQYRVAIAGQERSFSDNARQCAERARHAAVFVAIVLDPPTIPEPAEPAPTSSVAVPAAPPLPERPAPPPTRAPPPSPSLDLTLAPIVHMAPGAGDRRPAVAAGMMAWARVKRGFHLALGSGVSRGSLHFDNGVADAWRIPIHVAAGFNFRADRWEGGAEIGPSVTILSALGRDLQRAESQIRLEWGGRAAGFSRFWLSSNFALYLAAEALVHPSAYAMMIDPDGRIGFTPALWLGGSAGVTFRLE
jgi:hypothetical protein